MKLLIIMILIITKSAFAEFKSTITEIILCPYDTQNKTYDNNCTSNADTFNIHGNINMKDSSLILNGKQFQIDSILLNTDDMIAMKTKNDKNVPIIMVFTDTFMNLIFEDSLRITYVFKQQPTYYTGSAFGVNRKYLVTNYHVVEKMQKIAIKGNDDFITNAKVKYVDQQLDLAILETTDSINACRINNANITIGTDVMAYGYPQIESQGISLKVTKGIISSKFGYQDDIKQYQIDAPIQQGNSGGPLTENYKVVGVVVSMLKKSQNVNYAIKASFLTAMLISVGISNDGNTIPEHCTYMIVGKSE